MSSYKAVQSKNGRIMYYKDNHLISRSEYPFEMLDGLDNGIGNEPVPNKDESKYGQACIFCGETANHSRLVNLQTVDLCGKHYYDANIGQIAEKLRELSEI